MKIPGGLARGGALLTLGALAVVGWDRRGAVASPVTPGGDSVAVIDRARLGLSGNLRVLVTLPHQIDDLVRRALRAPAPSEPGVHRLAAVAPDGDSVSLVTLLPFERKTGARLGDYRLGQWPAELRGAAGRRGGLPAGFIEVTRENRHTPVSKQFRLADFLTHDQQGVWPKYLLLEPRLVDKLELIGQRLARLGKASSLRVMSGFRTPQYNAKGVGPLGGRARDSRHMYGDAADVFVDEDGDGAMDDLDGDGRVTVADGRFLLAVAEEVEKAYPDLVGGLSAYPANRVHGPFVHVDARGHRARW